MLDKLPPEVMAAIVDNDPIRSQNVCLTCASLAVHKDAAVDAVLVRKSAALVRLHEAIEKETWRLVDSLREHLRAARFRWAVDMGTELFAVLSALRARHAPPSSRVGVMTTKGPLAARFEVREWTADAGIKRWLAVGHVTMNPRNLYECLTVDFRYRIGRGMMADRLDRHVEALATCELEIRPETPTSGVIELSGLNTAGQRVHRRKRYSCGWFNAVLAVGFLEW